MRHAMKGIMISCEDKCRLLPLQKAWPFGDSSTQRLHSSFQKRGSPKPCRVTNNEEEMIDPAVPYAYDTGMVNLGPQYQVPNPELGPLERRVEKTFVEAMFTEEVNLDDMNYWFSEPEVCQGVELPHAFDLREGGWNSEDVWAHNLPEEEPDPITAANFGPGRTHLHELEEGTVMTGTVTCIMYYHGVQVDLGAQYDGLVPVRKEEWQKEHWRLKYGVCTGVADSFEVGQEVTVRIHRINQRPRCRWPIQLVVLDPDVQHKLSDPDLWSPPFDLRGVKSYLEAFKITGRPMPPPPPAEITIPDDTLYSLQQQFQSRAATAEAYSTDSGFFDRSSTGGDILDRISRHKLYDDLAPVAEVTEDDEAYDESYSSL